MARAAAQGAALDLRENPPERTADHAPLGGRDRLPRRGVLGRVPPARGGRALAAHRHRGGRIRGKFRRSALVGAVSSPRSAALLAGAGALLRHALARAKAARDYMEAVVLGDGIISARSQPREMPLGGCSPSPPAARSGAKARSCSSPRCSPRSSAASRRTGRRRGCGCWSAAARPRASPRPTMRRSAARSSWRRSSSARVAMEIFGPLVFASVVATLTVRQLPRRRPALRIPCPPFGCTRTGKSCPTCLLGLFGRAGRAVVSARCCARASAFRRARGCRSTCGCALGGLIVGALAILHPEVCGNGYSAVNRILHGGWVWQVVAAILALQSCSPPRRPSAPARSAASSRPRSLSARASATSSALAAQRGWPGAPLDAERLRPRRHGRVSRRHHARADHGDHHDFRAHARLPDHPPAHARLRRRALHLRRLRAEAPSTANR